MPLPQTETGFSWLEMLIHDRIQRYEPQFLDCFRVATLPTEQSIKTDVGKLRSVSPAGKKWITEQRMRRRSVGPYSGLFVFPDRDGRYPTIIHGGARKGYSLSKVQFWANSAK